jgi:prepilin-type N-terminal cleavage/methylation domain-containing protein
MKRHGTARHPVTVVREAMRRRRAATTQRELDDSGFTLIELIITVAIMPIVVGGIAVALISVFTLQGTVQKTVGDSNDELVSAGSFDKDVQSAQLIQTVTSPACGPTSGQQVVALEWGSDPNGDGGYSTVVSYVTSQVGTEYELLRLECTAGASATPSNSFVVAHDVGTPTVTLNPTGFSYRTNQGWTSTQGLYGVTLNANILNVDKSPGSGYSYVLSGVPSASSSTGSASQVVQTQDLPGCNLANPGSGAYANVLCFADFSAAGASPATQASYLSAFTHPSATCTQMTYSIADSPDLLQFCLSVTPVSGYTNGQTVAPQAIPTYDDVAQGGNSEPYLGNNGFYQGIQGDPAISQRPQPTDVCGTSGQPACTFGGSASALTTLTFTNIKVTNAANEAATGWTLVTGDAESTDNGEWNVYSNTTSPAVDWQILPNSATSFYGNSCYDSQDGTNSNSGLFTYTGTVPPTDTTVGNPSTGTGLSTHDAALAINATAPYTLYPTGAASVGCEANGQLDKTGALMLAAPEPTGSSASQSVSITMQGGGYQAVFLGVLL